ncbi:MAG TPA: thioredoxin-disulfide reductase [Methylomirabilota bacterium]|nr:thioredoxin-disulfide reductase [Methylomirabilota bacterium]
MPDYEVAIIGSGPAGLTAAIYAARALVKTLVIAGRVSGGQLMLTSGVENFPGFSTGVQGPDLMAEMRKQAEHFGTEIVDEDVESIELKQNPKRIVFGNRSVTASAVIIATGSSAKWLGMPTETKLRGRGVSSCATCDGYFFRNKAVAVVGGGDTALEEALFLTKYATEVVIIHRRDKLRASKIMQKRAMSNPKIRFLWDSVVDDVLGQNKVESLKVRNLKTGEVSMLICDGLFIAIGFQPNTKIFNGQIELDEKGYVIVRNSTETSAEGVFVAGDVHDYKYRQAITAAGEGCKAAIDALAYLDEQKEIAVAARE